MSGPTATQPPAALPLTPDEQRVLSAFRSMDSNRRIATLAVTEAWAQASLSQKRPTLSLIQGGSV
ncbi:hypothetical protein [Rugamonas rubra]|uniref:Uncharacterized protein n=1 Tax=Rugamonas rubra TaxID=758825 RepID=A0A1I4SIH9_9BURK|nr:hypothetical protein [Rugamonas rubra]SFM64318.1 hypothetical protein SAMN02982985_04800 [Rugamonas rubra]